MKSFTTLLVATLAASSQAAVLQLFNCRDCNCGYVQRNVYDNTCAYTQGFQSVKMIVNGGHTQALTFYSKQQCAGPQTGGFCATDSQAPPLGKCINTNGGSNAITSYSAPDCNY